MLFHKTRKSKVKKFSEVISLSTQWSYLGSNVFIVCSAFQSFALLWDCSHYTTKGFFVFVFFLVKTRPVWNPQGFFLHVPVSCPAPTTVCLDLCSSSANQAQHHEWSLVSTTGKQKHCSPQALDESGNQDSQREVGSCQAQTGPHLDALSLVFHSQPSQEHTSPCQLPVEWFTHHLLRSQGTNRHTPQWIMKAFSFKKWLLCLEAYAPHQSDKARAPAGTETKGQTMSSPSPPTVWHQAPGPSTRECCPERWWRSNTHWISGWLFSQCHYHIGHLSVVM